jgi:hypothetical protein
MDTRRKCHPLFDNYIHSSAMEKMILLFWNKIKMKRTGNHNSDYGGHSKTLNFPQQSSSQDKAKAQRIKTSPEERLDAWKKGLEFIPETCSKRSFWKICEMY